jgi:hypothetical protein
MLNILVLYWDNMPRMRTTTHDHLYCFDRYLDHRVYYLNLESETLPWYATQVAFDIIIFHDLFFCGRWGGRVLFEKLCRRIPASAIVSAVKIAVPQDEFVSADLLCECINAFGIEAVFSVSPASEWPKIYRDIDRSRVRLYEVLTGYIEELTLARIESIVATAPPRRTDIGYRAGGRSWRQAAWLGRHGVLKIEIGEVFAHKAPSYGLSTDISSRSEDVLMADDWYRFLASCKYTIGLEGGASILDWDGELRLATFAYVEAHPQASLDEIEAACFPGRDGELALYALSPRHLEACATRTCQILIEGAYNSVLEADRHYIPLRRDFRNLDEVLTIVKSDDQRQPIVDAAYCDIIESGSYTYRRFAEFILAEAVKLKPELSVRANGNSLAARLQHARYRTEAKFRLPNARSPVGATLRRGLEAARQSARGAHRALRRFGHDLLRTGT